MYIADFYREAPVLAGVLTLAYAIIIGVFVYMFVKMYKN